MKKILICCGIFIICAVNYSFAAEQSNYNITANDVLEISVYDEPDLTKTVRVSEQGMINFPFLGNIKAAGLSAQELEKEIRDLLAEDYLVNPQVTVFVKEYSTISVLGQVQRPGAYELKGSLTLMDTIALAGGFTEAGDPSRVKIIRKSGDKEQAIVVDTASITDVAGRTKDTAILPGDVIFVEEYQKISVLGQVQHPGAYKLKRRFTLMDAITAAGGFSEASDPSKVKVVRQTGIKKETLEIDTTAITEFADRSKDIPLKSDDVVMVPEYGKISILGQVSRPGSYSLRKGLTALDAIALAGGFTKIAAVDATRVVRMEEGKKVTLGVKVSSIMAGNKNLDILLQPGDTIVIPESFF